MQPNKAVQQRRFAGAVAAEEGPALAFGDSEIQSLANGALTDRYGQLARAQ
jgi:hypothetical protein